MYEFKVVSKNIGKSQKGWKVANLTTKQLRGVIFDTVYGYKVLGCVNEEEKRELIKFVKKN